MAKQFDKIETARKNFIEEQPIFFDGSAASEGRTFGSAMAVRAGDAERRQFCTSRNSTTFDRVPAGMPVR